MSDLKLIAKKEEVEKEISLLEKQKAKHGEIWSTEEAYLVVLQDWLTLHAEVERLRAALEWYADMNNYCEKRCGETDEFIVGNADVVIDNGDTARRALEGKE